MCMGQSLNVSSCNINASESRSGMFFTTCNVAQVTSISPLSIAFDTLLNISGKIQIEKSSIKFLN